MNQRADETMQLIRAEEERARQALQTMRARNLDDDRAREVEETVRNAEQELQRVAREFTAFVDEANRRLQAEVSDRG